MRLVGIRAARRQPADLSPGSRPVL